MIIPEAFPLDRSEPLATLLRPTRAPEAFAGARCDRFEFSSRGDRVPGRLFLPAEGRGRFPLILLQHGLGGSKESDYMESAAPWVRGGAAVASIDFPLHGERASAKLGERLAQGLARPEEIDDVVSALWIEFARQAVCDLRRAMDALSEAAPIDADRIAYAGFSLGGIVGAHLCAQDPRPRAAALALAGGGLGPPEVDPCASVGSIAPRPILFVNAKNDERVPPRATEALYAAAGEPKRIEWFDASHGNLPGVALKAMWSFLRDHLEIS